MSERDQYIEKAKAKIDRWSTEIDKMKAKLKEMREASDDAWADKKAGFDKAWDSITGAFDSAMFRFK